MTVTNEAPWAISVLRLDGQPPRVVPMGYDDMDRDARWAMAMLERMGIRPGLPVHLIGSAADFWRLWPFEDALTRMKVPFGQGEGIDVPRSAMFIRRLKLQAVLAIPLGMLDALPAQGIDVATLFPTIPVISAPPDACDKLIAMGCSPWRQVDLGPVYAFEPPAGGGYIYNHGEWLFEEEGGRLLVSNRRPRMAEFNRVDTGLRGRLHRVDGEHRVILD